MPETYEERARQAEALARKAVSEKERQACLEIADAWRALAAARRKPPQPRPE